MIQPSVDRRREVETLEEERRTGHLVRDSDTADLSFLISRLPVKLKKNCSWRHRECGERNIKELSIIIGVSLS